MSIPEWLLAILASSIVGTIIAVVGYVIKEAIGLLLKKLDEAIKSIQKLTVTMTATNAGLTALKEDVEELKDGHKGLEVRVRGVEKAVHTKKKDDDTDC